MSLFKNVYFTCYLYVTISQTATNESHRTSEQTCFMFTLYYTRYAAIIKWVVHVKRFPHECGPISQQNNALSQHLFTSPVHAFNVVAIYMHMYTYIHRFKETKYEKTYLSFNILLWRTCIAGNLLPLHRACVYASETSDKVLTWEAEAVVPGALWWRVGWGGGTDTGGVTLLEMCWGGRSGRGGWWWVAAGVQLV